MGLIAHAPLLVLLAILAVAHFLLLGANAGQVTLTFGIIAGTLGKAMPVFMIGVAALWAIRLLVIRARRQFIADTVKWFAKVPWPEVLLLRLPLAFGFTLMLGLLHLSFKVHIADFSTYDWDPFFARLDRALFLGHDPWTITHGLMPDLVATLLIDMFYMLWFLVMQVSVTAAALMPLTSRLRLTFLTAYGLNWIGLGVVLAIVFASGGPVYMEGMTGDTTFRPLTDHLQQLNQVERIMAIEAQKLLWDGFTNPDVAPLGISAFPSMHVAIAVTCACLGFTIGRGVGVLLTVFALGIFVGSVHLGWHYAVDGLFSAPAAVLIWWLSARFSRWWLALAGLAEPESQPGPRPAWIGAPQPVLAAEPAVQEPAGFAKNRFSTSR